MSLQQKTVKSEGPDPSKNYIERLPTEIMDEIFETFHDMTTQAERRNHWDLVSLCEVSQSFCLSARRVLYRDLRVYATLSSRRSSGDMLLCIRRLESIASVMIKNKDLARQVQNVSLTVVNMICDPDPPFITDRDMQALAPLLPHLQKLANEEPNCAKLLPVAEGDNIMDAFLEALLALFSNAKEINVELQVTLRGFPRLLRLASHLDLPVRLTLNLARPSWQLEEFLGWRFCRENGSSMFALDLEKSALCLYRHIMQSATAHDLASLRISAGKQTLPLDVEDFVSMFNTHKAIRKLTLDWTPWHSGDPSEPHPKTSGFPLRSYFSLQGLQNLQELTVSSRVLKAALTEPSSGSFAHMLPKSLEMLFISGGCGDWQIAALHDLVRGKHLPNLSRVEVGKIVGLGVLLQECRREMRDAEIEFVINP